jgi:hypothetical protein
MEVVLGHGGDLARFADFFSSWLQDIDRMDGRRMLYIRDRDEVPYTILSQLEASSAVHVLRRRELENYLLEPEAISEALVQREVVDPGSVDPVTVRRLLREGADKLKMVAIVVGRLISVHQAVLRSLVGCKVSARLVLAHVHDLDEAERGAETAKGRELVEVDLRHTAHDGPCCSWAAAGQHSGVVRVERAMDGRYRIVVTNRRASRS